MKPRKQLSKLMAVILTAAMVLGAMPVTAGADEARFITEQLGNEHVLVGSFAPREQKAAIGDRVSLIDLAVSVVDTESAVLLRYEILHNNLIVGGDLFPAESVPTPATPSDLATPSDFGELFNLGNAYNITYTIEHVELEDAGQYSVVIYYIMNDIEYALRVEPVYLLVTMGVQPMLFAEAQGFGTTPMVAAGFAHSVALKSDGTVWTWGNNWDGQLGDGTTENRYTPVQVNNLINVRKIAAGSHHTVALRNDGTAWAWGNNQFGSLGDGTTAKRHKPVQVENLKNVVAIAASTNTSSGTVLESGEFIMYTPSHTVALRNDGTVWTWGYNAEGQLGDGTTVNRYTPVKVQNLDNVAAIAAGNNNTIALRYDGTVWVWGQIRVGTFAFENHLTPIQVQNINDVIAISAGESHFVALKSDGSIWSWGSGRGLYPSGIIPQPTQMQGFDDVATISAGFRHTVVLLSDGEIWAWGDNGSGQIGNGRRSTLSAVAPVRVVGDSVAVAAGGTHTISVRTDGSVWSWGDNDSGQLGLGSHFIWAGRPWQVRGLDGVGFLYLGESSGPGLPTSDTTITLRPFHNGTTDAMLNILGTFYSTTFSATSENIQWSVCTPDAFTFGPMIAIAPRDGDSGDNTFIHKIAAPLKSGRFHITATAVDGVSSTTVVLIDLSESVAEFIQSNGTFVYAPVLRPGDIGDIRQSFRVYRVNGRVVQQGEGFSVVGGRTSYYLIEHRVSRWPEDPPVITLVTDEDTLQRLGFLHFGVNYIESDPNLVGPPIPPQVRVNNMLNRIRTDAEVRMGRIDYLVQMAEINDTLVLLSDLTRTMAVAAIRLAVFGKFSLLLTAVEFVGSVIIAETVEGLNELVPVKEVLLGYYNEERNRLIAQTGKLADRFNDPHAFYRGYLRSYSDAVLLETVQFLEQAEFERSRVLGKYLGRELEPAIMRDNLQFFGGLLAPDVVEAFLVVAFYVYDATTTITTSSVEGVMRDRDIIRMENNIHNFHSQYIQRIKSAHWTNLWGNMDFILAGAEIATAAFDITHDNAPDATLDQVIIITGSVDVRVYDSGGRIIGKILDGDVYSLGMGLENILVLAADEGIRSLSFPHDADYRIEIEAKERGIMTYREFRLDAQGNTISCTSVRNILVTVGDTFIINGSEDSVNYGALLMGGVTHTVTVNAAASDGMVFANGDGFVIGDTVILTAAPNEGFVFDGWYENGIRLAHAGVTYVFTAAINRTLEARFAPTVVIPPADSTLIIVNAFANPGETATIRIRLDNNPGFATMVMRLSFYEELTLTGYELGRPGLTDEELEDLGNKFTGPLIGNNDSFMGWVGRTSDVELNGVLLNLTFSVSTEADFGDFLPVEISFENYITGPDMPENTARERLNIGIRNGGVRVQEITIGDASGDGRVTSGDGTVLARHLVGHGVTIDLRGMDLNLDGYVDGADLVLLANWLLGRGAPPAVSP